MEKRLLLVVNLVAGKMAAKSFDIPALFADYDVTVYHTEEGAGTEKYVAANAPDYDLLVCVGGDGTLNNVINGVMKNRKRPQIGYLPSGTTNDFATSLGIPKDIPKAAQKCNDGTPTPIDIGVFNRRNFVYVASFGAFTDSSYKAAQETKNKLGHMAYLFEAVKELPNIRPCHMTVTADGTTISGDYIFGAVTNSTSIGGMLKINSAEISYNDGLFEVILIKAPQNAFDLQKILFGLLRQQYDEAYITFLHAKDILFTTENAVPWSLDGEYHAGGEVVHVKNRHNAVSLRL